MSSATSQPPAAVPTPPDTQHEVRMAVRNALQLGGSLLLTYGIAFLLRVVLPRYLGPVGFGIFSWADSFTAVCFVVTTLGLDTYIRKEVSLRPGHASDFFGGTLVLRLGMTVLLLGAISLLLERLGKPPEVRQLVFVCAGAQLLINVNATLAAMLQARGTVGGLSIVHVAAKLVWGATLLGALFLRVPLGWLAVPLLCAELLKAGALYALARRHLGLLFRVDVPGTWAVLRSAWPYYLTSAALACNVHSSVMVLGLLSTDTEVGYFGAAWALAGMVMMITPIFSGVLMPMMARAAARSREELSALVRRTLEGCLALTVPLMLALGLGAEVWLGLLSGGKYLPGALALRILSPVFVLTYMAMVSSTWLTLVNRAWTVTLTSVIGMVVSPALSALLVGPGLRLLGPSGAASANALATVLTEVVVVSLMLSRMDRGTTVDRRTLLMLGKTLGVCACVIGLHLALPAGVRPVPRLLLEAFVYVVLVLATGAVKPSELAGVLRLARQRRAAPVPVPAT